MDWSKLDPGLAGAMADDDATRRYPVFVHLTSEGGAGVLSDLGVEASGAGTVRTASLTADDVARLTERDEISHLRLSAPLRPGA